MKIPEVSYNKNKIIKIESLPESIFPNIEYRDEKRKLFSSRYTKSGYYNKEKLSFVEIRDFPSFVFIRDNVVYEKCSLKITFDSGIDYYIHFNTEQEKLRYYKSNFQNMNLIN